MTLARLVTAFLLSHTILPGANLCDAPARVKPGQRTKEMRIEGTLIVWEGRMVFLPGGSARRERPKCGVWVESALPPTATVYIHERLEQVMRSSVRFTIAVAGTIERAKSFKRIDSAPHPGNGFGADGSYEYRLIVARWITATPAPEAEVRR